MEFPYYLELFGLRLHPHLVLELLAYTAGMQLYLFLRRRWPRAVVPFDKQAWILVGCVIGAMVGSKGLAVVESWPAYWAARGDLAAVMAGKTIVGGLLGGWAGVEITKRLLGVRDSTGDPVVFPLIVGTIIGRVGCFLTGLADQTHGVHTSLSWAIDFGDGPRHPTQLYEIAFLLLLGIALLARLRRPSWNGELFRLYLAGYLLFRFAVEFIKPSDKPFLGLSAIQVACVAGVALCIASLVRHARASSRPIEAAGATMEVAS